MAQAAIELAVEKRERAGKGAARATRRNARVPAVIYGGKEPPVAISLDLRETARLLKNPRFLSQTFDIMLDGDKHHVLARDVQYHPVTDNVLHIDFLRIGEDTRLNVYVPVQFLNEEQCPGLKAGGVLNVVRFEVEVICRAVAIPEALVVDLAQVQAGDSVHISSVTLPDGVRPAITDRDFTIATIAAPSGMKATTTETEGEDA